MLLHRSVRPGPSFQMTFVSWGSTEKYSLARLNSSRAGRAEGDDDLSYVPHLLQFLDDLSQGLPLQLRIERRQHERDGPLVRRSLPSAPRSTGGTGFPILWKVAITPVC